MSSGQISREGNVQFLGFPDYFLIRHSSELDEEKSGERSNGERGLKLFPSYPRILSLLGPHIL